MAEQAGSASSDKDGLHLVLPWEGKVLILHLSKQLRSFPSSALQDTPFFHLLYRRDKEKGGIWHSEQKTLKTKKVQGSSQTEVEAIKETKSPLSCLLGTFLIFSPRN